MIAALPFWGSIATSNRSSRLRVPEAQPLPPVQTTPTWVVVGLARHTSLGGAAVVELASEAFQVAEGTELFNANEPYQTTSTVPLYAATHGITLVGVVETFFSELHV